MPFSPTQQGEVKRLLVTNEFKSSFYSLQLQKTLLLTQGIED